MKENLVLKIHPDDNVLVALSNLKKGTNICFSNTIYKLNETVKSKHKFSIKKLDIGEYIYMYGVIVGKAKKKISIGDLISQKNIEHFVENYSLQQFVKKNKWLKPDISNFKKLTFNGYHRSNGSVGTQNNWIVIPLVFCENRNVDLMKKILLKKLGYEKNDYEYDVDQLISDYKSGIPADKLLKKNIIKTDNFNLKNKLFKNVDRIQFLTHDGGCGGTRYDANSLCMLLAGYINNPNVGGATIISLGCQNAQINILKKYINKISPDFKKPIYYLEQQQSISEKEFIAEAVKKTFVGIIKINEIKREPSPLNKLVIGLECGGSDGFSGISANPTLGLVSDIIVALGGRTILSEFPELNGVEKELIKRCNNLKNAEKFVSIMQSYKNWAEKFESGFFDNPSPGNIKDGLITDAIKSAGAAKKGGISPIVDILDYGEQIKKNGLSLLCTPGNDVESTTGLAGSGANIILFTTGLGTPTGNPITPVIKISSNSGLYSKMKDIIDFDCGKIIDGKSTIQKTAEELIYYIIEIASGNKITNSNKLNQNDFIPWKRGVSL